MAKLEYVGLLNHAGKKRKMIPLSFINVHFLLTAILFEKLERAL
jgi:hypothetical protein